MPLASIATVSLVELARVLGVILICSLQIWQSNHCWQDRYVHGDHDAVLVTFHSGAFGRNLSSEQSDDPIL